MTLPLGCLKVLDLSRQLPGPFCSMLLADLGADVLLVDRDRCIGFDDLKVLTSQWLQQGSGLTGDLNSDSKVDFSDLSVLGDNWPGGGPCP